MKIRSKREAERLAHDEERERAYRATLDRLKQPGDGYASVGMLPIPALQLCLRCSALVYGTERHDAWHAAT